MRLYLDHNATSPLADTARAALLQAVDSGPLNAGSIHADGQRARAKLEAARRTVLRSLGVTDGQLVFCSGATEANNLAIGAVATSGRPLVVSRLEHPSVVAAAESHQVHGLVVRWLPHDERGRIDRTAARNVLQGAGLCALMAANNELGNRNDIDAIGALCAELGVALHVDAAQVAGRWAWRVPRGVSSVSLSAHKAGGPVGIGALWIAPGHVVPALHHGGHQERGIRPGTEPVALAAAMAAVYAAPDPRWNALEAVRDAIETVLGERGAQVNGDVSSRLPNTLNFSWPELDAEAGLMALDLAGYSLSAGSACTAGSIEPSPVIAALGLTAQRARGAMRISLGPEHAGLDGAALGAAIAGVLEGAVAGRAAPTLQPGPRR